MAEHQDHHHKCSSPACNRVGAFLFMRLDHEKHNRADLAFKPLSKAQSTDLRQRLAGERRALKNRRSRWWKKVDRYGNWILPAVVLLSGWRCGSTPPLNGNLPPHCSPALRSGARVMFDSQFPAGSGIVPRRITSSLGCDAVNLRNRPVAGHSSVVIQSESRLASPALA